MSTGTRKARLVPPSTDSRMIDKKRIKPAPTVESPGGDHFNALPPTIQDQDVPRRDDETLLRSQRADFRANLFTQAILQKGRYIVWRKALICPCINPTTQQVMINCLDCDGSGFVYVDPVRIQAWISNFDQRLDIYKHAGQWLSGEGSATLLAEHRAGFRDSLELEDDVMPFNELLQRGDRKGTRETLPLSTIDSARYRIAQIVRIAYKDSDGRTRLAIEKVHYNLDADNGWLIWLPAGEKLVPPDSYFSLSYTFHPVYIVTSYANQNRSENSIIEKPGNTIVALPLRVLIKLDFLTNVNAPVTGPLGSPKSECGCQAR